MARPEPWVWGCDVHGDKQDPRVMDEFYAFCRHFRPKRRFAGGDVFNFPQWRTNASQQDRMQACAADYQAGCDFLKRFKPTDFLWGNHDDRVIDVCHDESSAGDARELARQWIDHIYKITPGCKHTPYHVDKGVVKYGDFKLVHGYHHGENALKAAVSTYGSVLMGHIHTVQVIKNKSHEPQWGYSSGCLCYRDQRYNDRQPATLRQEAGWLYGIKTKRNKLIVMQARQIDGRWVIPMDL